MSVSFCEIISHACLDAALLFFVVEALFIQFSGFLRCSSRSVVPVGGGEYRSSLCCHLEVLSTAILDVHLNARYN